MAPLDCLLSGGQTGADRAALDTALRLGIPHGGWCPAGRRAEDGPLDARYELRETPSADYAERTEWNVRDSDGTVVFTLRDEATGGSRYTIECAQVRDRPCLHVTRATTEPVAALRRFVDDHGIRRLNVAGSRESAEPGIYAWVSEVLAAALTGPQPTKG